MCWHTTHSSSTLEIAIGIRLFSVTCLTNSDGSRCIPLKKTMAIIQLYTEEVSPELSSFLNQIKPNVDRYVEAKASAQRERMLIIGQVAEYREMYPQRSTDHRLLSQAMNSEWSGDVIKSNVGAYKEYKRLNETNVPEYMSVAAKANPSQLLALGRAEGTTLAYDTAQHLKKTGELPSSQALRKHCTTLPKPVAVAKETNEKCAGTPLNPSTPPAPVLSDEELELQRYGVSDYSTRKHILGLIGNPNLEHITTPKDAYIWHLLGGGSMQAMMPIIKQKLSQSSQFEVALRELVTHQVTVDVSATTVTAPANSAFSNEVHNGVRWRR